MANGVGKALFNNQWMVVNLVLAMTRLYYAGKTLYFCLL
jgi:hypothetical protein